MDDAPETSGAPVQPPDENDGSAALSSAERVRQDNEASARRVAEDKARSLARQARDAAQTGAEAGLSSLAAQPAAAEGGPPPPKPPTRVGLLNPENFTPEELSKLRALRGKFPEGVDQTATGPITETASAADTAITSEAADLLLKVDAGGVPAFITNNMERVARENGIDVTPAMTPNQIIEALRAKAGGTEASAPQARPDKTGGGARAPEESAIDSAQPRGEQRLQNQPAAKAEQPRQRIPSEAEQFISIYEEMSSSLLQRQADGIDKELRALEKSLGRASNLDDMKNIRSEMRALEDKRELIENIIDERGDEVPEAGSGTGRERGVGRQTREERQEAQDKAQRESRERVDEYRKLAKLSPDELNAEGQSEEAVLRALRKEFEGSRGADKDEASKRVRDSEARLEAINNLKESRAPESERKEDEARAKELEELRRESATVKQLEDEEKELKSQITDLEKNIKAASPADRRKLEGELLESRKKLKTASRALNDAKERAKAEGALDLAAGEETVRKLSPQEYAQLSEQDKAEYLKELAGALGSPSEAVLTVIKNKLKNGENLSAKEMGFYVRGMSDRMMKEGPKKLMKDLFKVSQQYPEIALAVAQRFLNTQEAQRRLQELLGGDKSKLEKVMELAGNKKHWLLTLLLILAGVGVSFVAPAAGAAISGLSLKGFS